MLKKQKVLVASSLHQWDDPRIFYKQCKTLVQHYHLTLMAISEDKLIIKDGIQIIGLSKPKIIIHRLINAVKIAYEVLKGDYTIFHFHDPELLWVGFIAKIFGKKVIFDIHENILGIVQIRNWIPKFFKKPLGFFILLLEKISQRIFDAIIVAVQPILKNFKNTFTIRNFALVDSEPTIKIKPKENTIVYVGAVTLSRGILDLIEVAIKLQKTNSSLKVIIIGKSRDQDFVKKLNRLIDSALIPNNIQYFGHINFLELKKYISTATLGVIPLHPNENYLNSYPTKIFDYMNWGLPYVYSDIPYWVKTFGDKCGGIPFHTQNNNDLYDKIEKIIYNDNLWSKLAAEGRKNIKYFSWNEESRKLLQIYQNL